MDANKDFKDLLRCLNQEKVEYIVVGAYAVIFYTEPRYTKDIDVWVRPDDDNAQRVFAALKKFGAPISGLSPKDFTNKKLMYQIGVDPNRVDVLMNVDGVSFNTAWKNRRTTKYDNEKIYVMDLKDLIKAKKAVHRLKDQIDVENLLKAVRKGK